MHLLDYLRNPNRWPDATSPVQDEVQVEYRLVCSGTVYPAHFLGDWSQSDVARILLQYPVQLLVASHPYDQYPQELALRFSVSTVEEREGVHSLSYHPDAEIASDFAALLTLLSRRLITVFARTREQYLTAGPAGPFPPTPSILLDYPSPIVTTAKYTHWAPRPIVFEYGLKGVQATSYRPPIQPIDSSLIMNVLKRLPTIAAGEAVIRAARLYALAMELIEHQCEICYQLLISAVETIAGEADLKWKPETKDKLELGSSKALISRAVSEGISREMADRLALEACKEHGWKKQRFIAFVVENVNHDDLAREDDLFWVPQDVCPKGEHFEKALKTIYRARSGATHAGYAFPLSACIGPSRKVHIKAVRDLLTNQSPFPPIGWFERLVNSAIRGYLRSQVEKSAGPIAAGPASGGPPPVP